MSVYNRKMFKRNARKALDQAAGVPPVQMFNNGGSVALPPMLQQERAAVLARQAGQGTSPMITLSPLQAEAIRKIRTPRTASQRIGEDILASDAGVSGAIGNLVGPPSSKLGPRMLQNLATGLGSGVDLAAAGGAGIASLFGEQETKGAGTKAAPAVMTPGVVAGLNDQGVPIPEDLMGVDLTTIPGFESGTSTPPLPAGTAPGTAVRIGEGKTKGRPPSPFDIFKADTEMTDIDMGPDEANMQAIAMADADMPSMRAGQDFQDAVDAADRDEADVDLAQTKKDTDTSTDTGTDKTLADSVEDMPTVEPEAVSPEQVAETLDADPETQEEALKRLMKEFTQNAPEYEGLDTGLAMAKIGFAMAAGKSPNAIENIANAMSDGADMLIKDKQNRDAFKRQVNLSALQYGLGEIGKQRAQERADERAFTDYAVAGDKPITYKGTTYQPGDTVSISVKDRIANGGKLPKGLQNVAMHTANQAAIAQREKNSAKLVQDAIERRYMSPEDQRAYSKQYKAAVKKASEAETAGTLIETVMLNADNIVGGGPAAKQAGANFLAFFGVDAPEGWNDQKLGTQDLKAALQSVVGSTLGSTQSANSISDRDVQFLIQGFLNDGVMKDNGDGTFAFVATSKEAFRNSLGNGLQAVRRAQAEALSEMELVDNQLAEMLTVGGRPGLTLTEPLRQSGLFTPGATAKEGVQIDSLRQGDDGIFEVNEDFFR